MPKDLRPYAADYQRLERVNTDHMSGLSSAQVSQRVAAGAVNAQGSGLVQPVSKIILKNSLTLFNIINLLLAIVITAVGYVENTIFVGIVLCNTAMGIFQELRAKKTLDKMSVIAQAKVSVVRDAKTVSINQDGIVIDDIVFLSAGDQICADAVVVRANGLEVDESLLTGETDRVKKSSGDGVLSGSYVTGGQAYVRVSAVGEDNYATALTAEAKKSKKRKPKLLATLNMIIRVLTFIIVPLGAMLFYSKYSMGETIPSAVLGAAAGMTGMIPGGLILLTGVTLTVGALNLARKKALVQALPSIETLARVDMLCLDKTGTITDGAMSFERMELGDGVSESEVRQAISELMGALNDNNATAQSLAGAFGRSRSWLPSLTLPFSSERKWSGASYRNRGSYILGSPNIVFSGYADPVLDLANQYAAQGYRVLCLAYSDAMITNDRLPEDIGCRALILLSDSIRADASDTFKYFAGEGVELKVISGDNPKTVSAVAARAGLENADKAIDMSRVSDNDDYRAIVEQYTVFGQVSPLQKRKLIRAMQKNGHTTCMTGDGVNDILAMREADCSVAMVSGSAAARNACDFVLMSSDFSSMVSVLKEGRRVINNIERVSSLYLVNTIYSVLLSLIYIFMPFAYPFTPLQMTPISALTVGIPSFVLALQANYSRPAGKLFANVFEHAFPAALTIVINTLYLQAASYLFDLPVEESSTMIIFLLGVVGFFLLFRISRPYTLPVKIMLGFLITSFIAVFVLAGDFFTYTSLFARNVFFYAPLLYFSYHIHGFLRNACKKILAFFQRRREQKEKW